MPGPQRKLIFVYNADSSPLAQVADFLHKTLSPETYECNLCLVTYGTFTAKPEWLEFIRSLPFRTALLHRDEFRKRYPALVATPLPAIFVEDLDEHLMLLISDQELRQARSVEELKRLVLLNITYV